MKVVIVNGQNHKGSTRMIARELAEKIAGQEEITEFFLPRDFDKPCIGCWTCFRSDLTHCPHYAQLEPLATAMDEADVILLASPVYVYHATGQMMAFLDHFGTQWIVHRPKEIMFKKQAVSICTGAGGGMKSTCKDMADSLNFWGIPKVYKLALGVRASAPDGIPDSVMKKIHRKTDALAQKIKANQNPKSPSFFGRRWFSLIRFGHKHMPPVEPDYSYWEERGWHGKNRPWK